MITEKKKRVAKPKKGIITDFVLNHCLGFLNLEPDQFLLPGDKNGEDLLRLFVKKIIEPFQRGEADSLPVVITWADQFEGDFFQLPEVRENLKNIQQLLRLQIHCAVNDSIYISKKQRADVVDSLSNISRYASFLEVKHVFALSGRISELKYFVAGEDELKTNRTFEAFVKVWSHGLPAIILTIILAALNEGSYFEKEPPRAGSISEGRREKKLPIKAFLGYCPNCESIFEKALSNNFLCSNSCKVMIFHKRKRKTTDK